MDEQALFDLLNMAEDQIIKNKTLFLRLWNTQITDHFNCDKEFKIEDHTCIYGGFKLSLDEFSRLDKCWRRFFETKGHIENNYIWLRGYGYYECDLQMHKKSEQITERTLWEKFKRHWDDYRNMEPFSTPGSFNVLNWLAAMSFLEYVFNDLTTLLWFIIANEGEVKKICDHGKLLSDVETAADETAGMLADLLMFEFSGNETDFLNRLDSVISNDAVSRFISESSVFSSFTHGCMRAVREADSLPLVYSAYLLKLSPFCERTSENHILFLSNAFGALNTGLIFKNLIKNSYISEHINVHYSQHRADSAAIGESSGEVKLLCSGIPTTIRDNKTCVIVIDDCIFTGKSYINIQKEFECAHAVYLLPLSLDVQSLKYYNRSKRNVEETYHISENAILWATELGEELPAFEAFWDWRNFSEEALQNAQTDFERIVCGGDVLLKELWIRYRKEIFSDRYE